ncbi:hypothetical protein NE237_024894 [Protea cynaroides]|uniref:Uncharacterized protein n=1 Tax=Protea cynaroides TaxID=273540 RepID=A0A9Q0K184_9MAGN|nr:hypothetical protein NE237_024894 [Protea cynaroides]
MGRKCSDITDSLAPLFSLPIRLTETHSQIICASPPGKMEDAEETTYSGQLSHKVVAIAAGEGHTLALAGDGSVYSWGRGTFGRLGTGKEDDELLPVRIDFDISSKMKNCPEKSVVREKPKFVEIAAGAYHSVALEDDGSVWCWGYNDCILRATYLCIILAY